MQTAIRKASENASSLPDSAALAGNIVTEFARAKEQAVPFRHWLFTNVLPQSVCRELLALPIVPVIVDTQGKRDSHNEVRRFFSPTMQAEFSIMRLVAEAFQSPRVVEAVKKLCGVDARGGFLRIEYCQDKDGFWLEPHMDIKEKFITLQLYLNTGEGAEALGTDLYDSDKKHFSSAPTRLGDGMLFVPKEPNSWHGFEKRPISDVRRSLIINYVTDDWRSVHELSFPDQKV